MMAESPLERVIRMGHQLRETYAATVVPELITQMLLVEILQELKVIETYIKPTQVDIEVRDQKLSRNLVVRNTTKKGKSLNKSSGKKEKTRKDNEQLDTLSKGGKSLKK
jgi:hypothetical protein